MNTQFKTSFIKNIGHTQMIIEPIISETDNSNITYTEDFRIKMVVHNSIAGLLKTHIQYINNIPTFCYDISGLQSLSILLENKHLDYNFLSHLIYKIYDALLACEKYMLDTDMLLLSPEHIFLSPDCSNIGLCYCPLKTDNFTLSLRHLFDYILKQIDHKDEKCIYIAYSIHSQCLKDNISPDILLSFLTETPSSYNNNQNIQSTTNTNVKTETYPKLSQNNSLSTTQQQFKNDYNISINTPSQTNNSLPNYLFKLGLITISAIICIIITSCLLLNNIIDFFVYFILLITILGIAGVAAFNIYKNNEGPLSNLFTKNVTKDIPDFYLEDSKNTILLSSIDNHDSHMLIYTGSDLDSQISITHYPFTIGKNTECDLIINNPIISRLHGRISCNLENNTTNYYIEDLNSSNGTYLNGTILPPYKPYTLSTGDNITFGHLTYIFR